MKRSLLIIIFLGILILPAMSQTTSVKDQKIQQLRERSIAFMKDQQMRSQKMGINRMSKIVIPPQELALEEELRNAVKSNDGPKSEQLREQLNTLRKQHLTQRQ